MDCIVQGTLKSLLQHHSSKASTLCCSAFFTVQLSHPYMTTGKTIALTRRFRNDLNQIPYNYAVDVTNRFKGVDLIDRVPEELRMEKKKKKKKNYRWRFGTLYRRQ